MNIYLVRHGQDDESVRGGWCTHGLIEEGIAQSYLLGKRLSNIPFDVIYSSDLNRAVKTTEIITTSLEKDIEIVYTDDLREINNGVLAGMKHELAEEKYPGMYYRKLQYNEKYPSGESPHEFYQRISCFWHEKLLRLDAKNVLVVSHGGVITIMLHLFNGIPYSNSETLYGINTGTVRKIKIERKD